MNVTLNRIKDDGKTTIGYMMVNGEFECFTIEDASHDIKIAGETCIPEGTYNIELRNDGGMTKKYSSRYAFHRGMLWLRNVENYTYVYIHTGNTSESSAGCILVNTTCDSTTGSMIGGASRTAYTKLYLKVLEAIDAGEDIIITVRG